MKKFLAGFLVNRIPLRLAFCALVAAGFSVTAGAQAIQPQTGSSGQNQQPQQAQPQQQPQSDQNQPADQSKKKPTQKSSKQNAKQPQQKKIKAHVVKQDKKKKDAVDTSQSAEPDKVLYERAMLDVKKGRYTEGRLSLQALINTYPDSEYLAKAKLAVADSYYKEGGTSNLTQAVDEYKNFIIFFPFLDEAAYAQMQIGMAHLRMMEKADRDSTQAQQAEQELQTFLLKYPQSPLVPKAEQDLRDVQEVLADGEYRIARFYYLKQDYPASTARLIEVAERYPLYSQSDQTLWMLADVYARAKRLSRNEDDRNHWSDLAGKCYARIAQDYPLSRLAPDAKSRLKAMGMAVPEADPQAVARMKQEQMYEKQHQQKAVVRLPMGVIKSGPSLALAAHAGIPNLNPPNDAVSARDVLAQGAKGPDFDLAQKGPEDANQQNSGGDTTPVESVVTPTNSAGQSSGVGNVGVQIIIPPDTASQPATQATPAATSGGTAPSGAGAPANPPATAPVGEAAPNANPVAPVPVQSGTEPAAASAAQGGGAAAADPPANPGASAPASGQPAAQPNGQTASAANSQNPQADAKTDPKKSAKSDKADPNSESSSKKKKGVKKIIPW